MNIIKPANLKEKDTIGILATSGPIEGKKENLLHAVDFFQELGYKVVLSENIFSKDRYLAGSDEKRVEELHKFFLNPNINAIICLRGGYGAIRLINKIDYSIIRNNPKIFCGHSDITALNAMFLKKAGLITYSGPMIMSDFAKENTIPFTVQEFFRTLKNNSVEFKADKIIKNGNAKGIFWGGNLSTLVSLCGQDFIPDKKFIFFMEDINEPVYKIDKMLTQLTNIKSFTDNIQGLVVGEFVGNDNEEWLQILINEMSEKLNIPVIEKKGITHHSRKITMPYGANAIIDSNNLILS